MTKLTQAFNARLRAAIIAGELSEGTDVDYLTGLLETLVAPTICGRRWFVYTTDAEGRVSYERTTGTKQAAMDRLKELRARGQEAFWSDCHIPDAFY